MFASLERRRETRVVRLLGAGAVPSVLGQVRPVGALHAPAAGEHDAVAGTGVVQGGDGDLVLGLPPVRFDGSPPPRARAAARRR